MDLIFFTGLLDSIDLSGILIVLIAPPALFFFLGLALSFLGSASTVTLIRQGLASPDLPVSIMKDLEGDEFLFGLREESGLTEDCRRRSGECGPTGDEGRVRGSGDVERSIMDILWPGRLNAQTRDGAIAHRLQSSRDVYFGTRGSATFVCCSESFLRGLFDRIVADSATMPSYVARRHVSVR